MIQFQILDMDKNSVITQETKLTFKGEPYSINTNKELCTLLKRRWMKKLACSGFKDWCKDLNECGDYVDTFTVYDALDNMNSALFLTIDLKPVNIGEFYLKYSESKIL